MSQDKLREAFEKWAIAHDYSCSKDSEIYLWQETDDAWRGYQAALSSPQWMPIETAPKDGSVFLGWVGAERWSHIDGGGSGYGHDMSQADFCWWRADFNCPNDGYFDNASGQIGDSQGVTHWMPIPNPPAAPSPSEES
jgi:hypothetical protein